MARKTKWGPFVDDNDQPAYEEVLIKGRGTFGVPAGAVLTFDSDNDPVYTYEEGAAPVPESKEDRAAMLAQEEKLLADQEQARLDKAEADKLEAEEAANAKKAPAKKATAKKGD